MQRDSSFFSSPVLTRQVGSFNDRLSECQDSIAVFNALVSDVEEFCDRNKKEIKANKKLNACISNLLNKSNELQQPIATRKIMRLRYLAAADQDRLTYISYYLKEFEDLFSKKKLTLEVVASVFFEIQAELENEAIFEDVRDGFFEILGNFVSQPNHPYPEKAFEIARFMKHADKIKPHHKNMAARACEKLAESCDLAAPWYSPVLCCSR